MKNPEDVKLAGIKIVFNWVLSWILKLDRWNEFKSIVHIVVYYFIIFHVLSENQEMWKSFVTNYYYYLNCKY